MNLRDALDRVPRRYRPLASLPGVLLGAKAAAGLGLISQSQALTVSGAAITISLGGVLSALAIKRFLSSRKVSLSKGGPGPDLNVKALEIEVNGANEERETAASSIASIVRERSRAGKARYLVISTLQGSYARTIIAIASPSPSDADVEAEILKTLIALNVKGAKITEVPAPDGLAGLASSLEPSSRASPVIAFASGGSAAAPSREGIINLGVAYDGAFPRPVSLTLRDVTGHVAIFGSTGTGKTTTLSRIVVEAVRLGINVVALDWAGEISRLTKGSLDVWSPVADGGVNPFTDRGLSSSPELLLDVLTSALALTQPQSYMLMRVLNESHPKSFEELEDAIEGYPEEARWDRDVKRGLLRKVAVVADSRYSSAFNGSVSVSEIEGSAKIIALNEIESQLVRRAYSLILLSAMFSSRVRSKHTILAIDEAHNLITDEQDLLGHVMAESRKYKLYIAIATQSPALMPNSVLLNANTKIVHALRSLRDKEVIVQSMNLPYDMASQIDKLQPGEAILQSPSTPSPLLIRVQLETPPYNEGNEPIIGEPINVNANVP